MPDNPPRSTARGAYLLRDLDMGKKYLCQRCGQLEIPYMVLVRKHLFLPYCSFNCAMFVHIQNDMKAKTDMFFQKNVGKPQLQLVPKRTGQIAEKREKGVSKVNEERDQYLKQQIIESGVAPEAVVGLDFSTWDGFGYLVKWAILQDWWEEFAHEEFVFGLQLNTVTARMLDPDVMADELWKFL